jgi:hypothetical protein
LAKDTSHLVKAAESTPSSPGPLAFIGCRGIHEARRRSRPCGSFSVKHYSSGALIEVASGFEPPWGALQVEKRRSWGFAEVQKHQVTIHIPPGPFSPIQGVPRYNDGIKRRPHAPSAYEPGIQACAGVVPPVPTSQAWSWGVSEDRLATLVHAPCCWKVAGQSLAGRHDQHLVNREGGQWRSHDPSGHNWARTCQQSGWVDRRGKQGPPTLSRTVAGIDAERVAEFHGVAFGQGTSCGRHRRGP